MEISPEKNQGKGSQKEKRKREQMLLYEPTCKPKMVKCSFFLFVFMWEKIWAKYGRKKEKEILFTGRTYVCIIIALKGKSNMCSLFFLWTISLSVNYIKTMWLIITLDNLGVSRVWMLTYHFRKDADHWLTPISDHENL